MTPRELLLLSQSELQNLPIYDYANAEMENIKGVLRSNAKNENMRCKDCISCGYCTACIHCISCENCMQCMDCEDCFDCTGCQSCINCWGCRDCIGIKDGKGLVYVAYGIQLTKEQYKTLMRKYHGKKEDQEKEI